VANIPVVIGVGAEVLFGVNTGVINANGVNKCTYALNCSNSYVPTCATPWTAISTGSCNEYIQTYFGYFVVDGIPNCYGVSYAANGAGACGHTGIFP
jgi:hypothetical protein